VPPDRRLVPRLATLVLAVVGGGVLSLAFPDVGWWPAAPVAVALLLVVLRRDHAGWNLLVGWVFSFVFFLIHLEFAQFAVGPVPWLLLSAAEALAVGLVSAVWTWLRRLGPVSGRPWLLVPIVATLWTGAEELRAVWPFGGFPWGRLAFSQATSPIGHLAWLGGEPLVSWVTCAVGALLFLGATTILHPAGGLRRLRLRPTPSAAVGAGASLLVVVALTLAGLLVPLDATAQSGELRVGAVQGNVTHPGVHAYAQAREVLDNHLAGTRALAARTRDDPLDLVLWPENGTDIDPSVDARTWTEIDDVAQVVDAPVLVGTVQADGAGGRYNVGLLWQPGVGPIDSYTKVHPVPFAEYIPLRPLARVFSSAVDLVRQDMRAGSRVGVLALPSSRLGRTVRVGDVICFEVAIDPLVRATVAGGAELLVVQTNNASFGPTAESTQQLAMTRLRAIETGRSTVQVSTVGVSAVVAPDGTVLDRSGLFVPAQLEATVPLRTGLTPAVRWGAWVAWALSVAAALLALGAVLSVLLPARGRGALGAPAAGARRAGIGSQFGSAGARRDRSDDDAPASRGW